jgi:hypothetical protein
MVVVLKDNEFATDKSEIKVKSPSIQGVSCRALVKQVLQKWPVSVPTARDLIPVEATGCSVYHIRNWYEAHLISSLSIEAV